MWELACVFKRKNEVHVARVKKMAEGEEKISEKQQGAANVSHLEQCKVFHFYYEQDRRPKVEFKLNDISCLFLKRNALNVVLYQSVSIDSRHTYVRPFGNHEIIQAREELKGKELIHIRNG